jgi:hypothetical protein
LAQIIRLNANDWKKWLDPQVVISRPLDLDTPLRDCEMFSVPNTAYIDFSATRIFPELRFFLESYRHQLFRWWREAGYFVRSSRWVMGKDVVLSHLSDPDIYAYAYLGHGAAGILVLGDQSEWIWPGKYTPFGIVQMHLIACESNSGSNLWKKNVSRHGMLVAAEGELSMSHIDLRFESGE